MTDTAPGPRSEDYPRDITVSNNLMTNIGVFDKQTAGVEISRAFRVTVSHNTIHDGPRAGINIGDGTWGGHRIDHNDIWNMVRETGDHGPINSWGRDRFWPISDATDAQRKAWSSLDHLEPTIIEFNRIWHDSEWAVDLDDGSSNYIVRNNLLLNAGIKFREGFNRNSTNNIYVNGSAHFHVSYADNGDQVTGNIFLTGRPYRFIRADPTQSKITYDKNLFWNNNGSVWFTPYGDSLQDWQDGKSQDAGSVVADPAFTGQTPWQDPATRDYTVGDDSPALTLGFTNIPMSDFGRPSVDDGPPPVEWEPEVVQESRQSLPEPWIGATVTGIFSDALASSVGLSGRDGLYLDAVDGGSVAAQSGLRSADVIQKINDMTVTDKNSFWRVWNTLPAGTDVSLAVWRDQAAISAHLARPGGVEKINNTSGVAYSGAGWDWKSSSRGGGGSHLDDVDASQGSGDSFELAFHGTRLTMSTQTNSDETPIRISVDGGPARTVDLRSPERVYQTQVFDTGALPSGQHTITATSTTGGYFIVDSFEITHAEAVKAASHTTLQAWNTPTFYDSPTPASFVARVSSGTTAPSGSVAFRMGETTLATVPLTLGMALYTLPGTSPAGEYVVTATYSGDHLNDVSTSESVTAMVYKAESTTELTAAKRHNRVTARIDVSLNTGRTPGGTVTVTKNSRPVGTVELVDGWAVWSGRWDHRNRTAVYRATFHPADADNHLGSTSEPVSISRR